jgi:hypothetical protein
MTRVREGEAAQDGVRLLCFRSGRPLDPKKTGRSPEYYVT